MRERSLMIIGVYVLKLPGAFPDKLRPYSAKQPDQHVSPPD